jgi:hypothetical protein
MHDRKNPISTWAKYQQYRQEGREIPEEILVYFDDCAENLMRLSKKKSTRNKTGAWEGLFARAMGFKALGPGTPFIRYRRKLSEHKMAYEIFSERNGRSFDEVCKDVARQENLSEDRVKGVYSAFLSEEKKKPWYGLVKKAADQRNRKPTPT